MNRNEFILELNKLLSDLSNSEREEAISYYEDYFDDAGPEAEQEVIRSLGSPSKVAANIKSGLNGSEDGEFSERGYHTESDRQRDEVVNRAMSSEDRGFHKKDENSVLKIVLIVLAGIVLLPFIAPFAMGLLGVLVGIISAAAATIFGIFVAGIAIAFVGIVAFILGIVQLFIQPALGILMIGVALILTGIGGLLAVLGVWIVTKLLPPVVRGIVSGCRKIFGLNK